MKATATLIYRNVFCGGGGTAFRCSVCENHMVIGICPRFCPVESNNGCELANPPKHYKGDN